MTSDHVYTAILAAILLAGAIRVLLDHPPSPGNAPGRGPGGESPR